MNRKLIFFLSTFLHNFHQYVKTFSSFHTRTELYRILNIYTISFLKEFTVTGQISGEKQRGLSPRAHTSFQNRGVCPLKYTLLPRTEGSVPTSTVPKKHKHICNIAGNQYIIIYIERKNRGIV